MTVLRIAFVLLSVALAATMTSADAPTPADAPLPPGVRDVRLHDPSTIVQCNDDYWLFGTGKGVISFHSRDLINWQRSPAVFEQRPAWVPSVVPDHPADGTLWAPDLIRVGGDYLLYYSVSTFGGNTSAIALARNRTLDPASPDYHWIDEGVVIRSTPADDFNAIDPALLLDADGRLWMAFGSFWSGIMLIELDPRTGRRVAPDSPIHALASHTSIEAPYLHRRGDFYYLFVNWGLCCRGVDSTYEIRIGRSRSVTGPYLDKDGRDLRTGGGTLQLGSTTPFIGPGHAAIVTTPDTTWLSCHFYDATHHGRPTLALRRLTWSTDGWPMVD